jgi:SAM-dependent methyltransferase
MNISCPICELESLQFITRDLRFDKKGDVYRCLDCELVFLDQKSFQLPEGFYENEYHQSYLTHVEPDALDPNAYFDKMLKVSAPWAKRFEGLLSGDDTILDMGCSTGHFMHLIEHKTKKVYGHELSIKEVAFCQDVKGLDVSNQPLGERFEPGTFDFITLIFVLEHISEPVVFLEYLKKFLKPGGKILIVVPNVDDPLVSFYNIPEFQSFYYCIEHLFYFNKNSISLLFDKAGLSGEISQVQEYPLTNHLNWIYRRCPSNSLAARKGIPDILAGSDDAEAWEQLWQKLNLSYREFLLDQGYADRLWCLVG